MGFTPDAEFPVVYGEKGIVRFHITGNVKKDGLIAISASSLTYLTTPKFIVNLPINPS